MWPVVPSGSASDIRKNEGTAEFRRYFFIYPLTVLEEIDTILSKTIKITEE